MIELRVYNEQRYEECLEKEANPYDNRFPLGTGLNRVFTHLKTTLKES